MDIIKIIGIAFTAAIVITLLKSTKPELSFVISIASVVIILLIVIDALEETIAAFFSIAQMSGMDNGLLKAVLKIIGVGYVTEFAASLLSDFGNASLADKVILSGKITVIALAMPIVQNLFYLLQGFLKLL